MTMRLLISAVVSLLISGASAFSPAARTWAVSPRRHTTSLQRRMAEKEEPEPMDLDLEQMFDVFEEAEAAADGKTVEKEDQVAVGSKDYYKVPLLCLS